MKSKVKTSLIVITTIMLIGIIFGVIDYIRTTKEKKPLFIFRTVNISDNDALKKGKEFYGIGYKIIVCDIQTNKYIFQLGYKNKNHCISTLTCNEKEEEYFETSHKFYFYEDDFFKHETTILRPIEKMDDEETTVMDTLKLNEINGVKTSVGKISDKAYIIKHTCELSHMSEEQIKQGCYSNYLETYELVKMPKDEIVDYYINTMTCEEE